MDKYDYKLKTEQMLELMDSGAYNKAAEVADTIDWKRVRNATILTNVSDIYEKNGAYQKSYEILNIAYHRAEGSRKVLYRLCALAIKTGNVDEAIDYYDDFMQVAPKDPNQHILKYKILSARKAPIDERIEALEEFKKAEYIEEWAYELAKLYQEAGMTAECLEECDDLILWFSEGKYVFKAMELKMLYKPLTPSQQERYDHRYEKMEAVTEEIPDVTVYHMKNETRDLKHEKQNINASYDEVPKGTLIQDVTEEFDVLDGLEGLNEPEDSDVLKDMEGLDITEKFDALKGMEGRDRTVKFDALKGMEGLDVTEEFDVLKGMEGLDVTEEFDVLKGMEGQDEPEKFDVLKGMEGQDEPEEFDVLKGMEGQDEPEEIGALRGMEELDETEEFKETKEPDKTGKFVVPQLLIEPEEPEELAEPEEPLVMDETVQKLTEKGIGIPMKLGDALKSLLQPKRVQSEQSEYMDEGIEEEVPELEAAIEEIESVADLELVNEINGKSERARIHFDSDLEELKAEPLPEENEQSKVIPVEEPESFEDVSDELLEELEAIPAELSGTEGISNEEAGENVQYEEGDDFRDITEEAIEELDGISGLEAEDLAEDEPEKPEEKAEELSEDESEEMEENGVGLYNAETAVLEDGTEELPEDTSESLEEDVELLEEDAEDFVDIEELTDTKSVVYISKETKDDSNEPDYIEETPIESNDLSDETEENVYFKSVGIEAAKLEENIKPEGMKPADDQIEGQLSIEELLKGIEGKSAEEVEMEENKKKTEPILPPDIQRLIDEIEGVAPQESEPEAVNPVRRNVDESRTNIGDITQQLRTDDIAEYLMAEGQQEDNSGKSLDDGEKAGYFTDDDGIEEDEYAEDYRENEYTDGEDGYEEEYVEEEYTDEYEEDEDSDEYEEDEYVEEYEDDEDSDVYDEDEYLDEYEEDEDSDEYEEDKYSGEYEEDEDSDEYGEDEDSDEEDEYLDEYEEDEYSDEYEVDEDSNGDGEYEEDEYEDEYPDEYTDEDGGYSDEEQEYFDEEYEEYDDEEYDAANGYEEEDYGDIEASFEEEFRPNPEHVKEPDDREIPDDDEGIDILSATTPLSRKETAKLIATGKTAPLPMDEISDALSMSDTGFVVHGRYDLAAQSGIGTRAGLTEEQKKLFSYFVPVRGMSEQLVDVLEQDINCTNREGTSRTGNLLIIGNKGNGKTVLAVDVVKAIQKQRNIRQGKVAIVTGDSLNKKKISDIFEKLHGGALIVEKAAKMNEKTVARLNKAMERNTGEMMIVLEEQRKPLDRLLSSNREFRRKFTSRLEVPIFINDELVTFGQTYAQENGYRIDEMGILALYSRIDALQREDHAVSIAEVKEVMDEAMGHSQKASAKKLVKRVFGKNTDDADRIILSEKDFNI